MPRKTFVAGQVLTDTDLNTFLMNQVVATFADSTARGTALPSPTEGMVTWLENVNRLDVWDGSSWQVVNDNTASVPLTTVTTEGDLIVATGNAAVTRLGRGTAGQVLTSGTATLSWTTPSADIPLNTVTSVGDLIVGTGNATVTRLGRGTAGQVLTASSTAISWVTPTTPAPTAVTFTTSGTWVVPAGVTAVQVYAVSGGAGGGGGYAQRTGGSTRSGFGGAGGWNSPLSYYPRFITTPGETLTITIGAGGAGGTAATTTTNTNLDGGTGSNGGFTQLIGLAGTITGVTGTGGVGGSNSLTYSYEYAAGGQMFLTRPTEIRSTQGQNVNGVSAGFSVTFSEFGGTPIAGSAGTNGTGGSAGIGGVAGTPGLYGYGGNGGPIGTATTAKDGGAGGGGAGGGGGNAVGSGSTIVTAGAGGNAAANSGAGGGGGGGASIINSAGGNATTSGAGGNGGSGFLQIVY